MTAPSELFCDEDVRDAALRKFGKRIPDYEYIYIPEEWKDIWEECCFPNGGCIKFQDINRRTIAVVCFEVRFVIEQGAYYKYIAVYPKKLRLVLPKKK